MITVGAKTIMIKANTVMNNPAQKTKESPVLYIIYNNP
jgi:hypothetical protein